MSKTAYVSFRYHVGNLASVGVAQHGICWSAMHSRIINTMVPHPFSARDAILSRFCPETETDEILVKTLFISKNENQGQTTKRILTIYSLIPRKNLTIFVLAK